MAQVGSRQRRTVIPPEDGGDAPTASPALNVPFNKWLLEEYSGGEFSGEWASSIVEGFPELTATVSSPRSYRWSGFFYFDRQKEHVFRIQGNNGYRLYLNNTLVENNWDNVEFFDKKYITEPGDLRTVRQLVRLEYRYTTLPAQISLNWDLALSGGGTGGTGGRGGTLPPSTGPGTRLLRPYQPPDGWTEALSIEDVYEVVNLDQGADYTYNVGIPTEESKVIVIRNKSKDNPLDVAVVYPEFLEWISSTNVTASDTNGSVRFELLPRQETRVSFKVSELAALNITMRREYEYTDQLKVLVGLKSVDSSVYVKDWS